MKNNAYLIMFMLTFCLILLTVLSKQQLKKRSVTNSRYYLKRIIWDKRLLTYALFGNLAHKNQTSMHSIKRSLSEAFGEWQNNSCFKFVDQTPSRTADIKIVFTSDQYAHQLVTDPFIDTYTHQNCERRLQGRAGHAFFRYHKKFPGKVIIRLSSRGIAKFKIHICYLLAQIHMNNEFFWMESKPSGSVSLKTVLLHEIGHVLGLLHSELIDSVMYEYIYTNQIKRIHDVDKQGLNKIYSTLCQKPKKFNLKNRNKIKS